MPAVLADTEFQMFHNWTSFSCYFMNSLLIRLLQLSLHICSVKCHL